MHGERGRENRMRVDSILQYEIDCLCLVYLDPMVAPDTPPPRPAACRYKRESERERERERERVRNKKR